MSIIAGGCRRHGLDCGCTPGVITQNLELFAECQGNTHEGERMGLVCCDDGHEFAKETGDLLGAERRTENRFPAGQTGHAWVSDPRCRVCCPNHSDQFSSWRAKMNRGEL